MDTRSLLCVVIGMLGVVRCPDGDSLNVAKPAKEPVPAVSSVSEASMIATFKQILKKYKNKDTCKCATWPDNFKKGSHFYADFSRACGFVAPNSGLGVTWHVPRSGTIPCQVRGVLKLVPPPWATKLTVDMCFKDPTEWSFNLGDSISNNGWGGDAGHGGPLGRCAEVHSMGDNTYVFRAVYHPTDRHRLLTDAFPDSVSSGPFSVKVMKKGLKGDYLGIKNYEGLNAEIYNDLHFSWDTMYLGINRVVQTSGRSGTGLCFVNILWEA